jgi:hypothetical protein
MTGGGSVCWIASASPRNDAFLWIAEPQRSRKFGKAKNTKPNEEIFLIRLHLSE